MNRQQRRHVSRRYPLCHATPAAVTPCAPRWSHWRGGDPNEAAPVMR